MGRKNKIRILVMSKKTCQRLKVATSTNTIPEEESIKERVRTKKHTHTRNVSCTEINTDGNKYS